MAREVALLEGQGNLLKKVVRVIQPTVVHIEAQKSGREDARPGRRSVEEAGAGVIIERNSKLYVLTNRHVVKDSSLAQVKIKLADNRLIHPTKVWTDRGSDVAIMEISATGLVPARLGDSDRLEIGDFVLAVGSPFGLSHSVSYGIISAKGRRDLKLGDEGVLNQDFLQTDAAINPGNSGGPLLNLRGEVVGINTAIASSSGGNEGIGFTIPINMVKRIAQQLIERGQVTRGYLGVRLDAQFDASRAAQLGLSRLSGALVTAVTPNSPASRANLQAGDVIVKINETRVEDDTHLINTVSLMPVGDEIQLSVYRGGKPVAIKVKVGDRDAFEPK
ncbi:MAG: trypsin-like peptidase domain-containing protein, partial [Planctomycetota bacterium]|nr:trypsin-like peptidase domain-containing protein [Planctomycetota bacterium]